MQSVTKQALEQINAVSRQLLSRILDIETKALESGILNKDSNDDETDKDELVTEPALIELMSKREGLISELFEQNTKEDIANELTLVNEMVSLDGEITSKSQACKQMLSEQVIRLKKGKKVSKSYQQY